MRHRRKTAVLMAAVTLSMSVASPVRAAAPRVQVDETMYVNMDYYGNMTTVNVVKGCSTNGVEQMCIRDRPWSVRKSNSLKKCPA